ncbi:serine hydrolase domain-containing protein [Aeromicrobium wangtongii]|uniref:serine hydrolase domain-containing protein n=1 Tax=Aeromicrobium wangtongii TaxID=2969247 RepID=UPI002017F2A3|nr:serine hydrolase domain-containing protein [Aeromicrobium wangtongii]MCL3819001.1 beta-lactamase family protein [Aeromicrobium wangtongii]
MRIRAALATGALLAVAACSGSADVQPDSSPQPAPTRDAPEATPSPAATPAPVFPGTRWSRAERGDWAALDADLAANGSTCVAVVKDGRLVHDAYWNGGSARTPQKVYSIAKSLSSLLAGMAAGDGTLDLDAPAGEHVEQWRGTDAGQVTARSLLSMTSGRRWSDAADRQMIRAVRDQSSYAAGLAQDAAPGERWVYDNAAVQTLESVLDDAVGADVGAAAQARLLDPLGMRDTVWGRDAAGNALTYSGMQSTCLDLARVGHLMLNAGSWRGRQIVPGDYVREATRPSSVLNAAYGLLWWTNAGGRVVEVLRQAGFAADKPPYRGSLAPNVPADAFWAFGYGNQYIAVVPSEGVVAVRLGARPATPDRVTFDGFTSGVLDALDR